MTLESASSGWATWSMRGWGPLVLQPRVKPTSAPPTEMVGTFAAEAISGWMVKPRLVGYTVVSGSTAT